MTLEDLEQQWHDDLNGYLDVCNSRMEVRAEWRTMGIDQFVQKAKNLLEIYGQLTPVIAKIYTRELEALRRALKSGYMYSVAQSSGMDAAVLWKLSHG